ncbi:MAG: cell division protein FtsA [Candidatus Magasanikbacteria bacterium]|jgi:cell division protein FtsA|nr:cell division protein FtsA [Candidatus Magasanikbacteria bacterium]MBT5262325.1 cell division protein FtsA [Candidatus Magasanikbacteria bacterium]MBT5820412.1 cell division protein FtsA [Candidatus Magasanikbacteria bacterium]MBT6294301.1 cell division protein FtsA [Candidatus Magasanikbacteria bacterium]
MVSKRQQLSLITGIDIGSTGIRVAVGQYNQEDSVEASIKIIATGEVSSEGIVKGSITSIEDAVSAISCALEEVDRLVGVPIENAWVGISGTQILSKDNRGVIAVAKSDGEIGYEDVSRVLESTQNIASPLNYEVLHVLPRAFTVDGQTGIRDPIGMTGLRLEVDAQMIYGATPHMKNITKAIYRTGIEIDDLVLGIVATADAVLTQKQKDIGVVIVDIGGSTTTIAAYEDGTLIHTAVIPIGSNHITNDIALGLQTSIDIAERVKLAHGSCAQRRYTVKDGINLIDFGGEDQAVRKKFLAEIISARVVELLEKIDQELAAVQRQALLPAGIIFTGGGAKLDGIVEITKKVLQMNAGYGYIRGIQSATDKINDLAFTGAIALVRWGAVMQQAQQKKFSFFIPGSKKALTQMRNVFKFLIP